MTSAMMAAGSLKVGVVHFGRDGVTGAYLGPSPKDVMRSNREAMMDGPTCFACVVVVENG